MSILFLKEKRSPSGIEGVGIYLLRLCIELNKRDIKHLVLYNDKDEYYKMLVENNINVKILNFPSQSPRNIYRGFKNIRKKIFDIIVEQKISLINVHFPHLLNFLEKKWNIEIICHSHGADPINNKIQLFDLNIKNIIKNFYNKYYIFNFNKANKVISVSDAAKNTAIKKFNVPKKKIYINRYGLEKINVDNYNNIRKEYQIEESKFLIISVGRITKDKGVEDFCKVAKYFSKNNNNLAFMFIGEYRDKDYYNNIYKKYKDYVIFTGMRENVFDYFKSADLFLFLSYRESAGQVLMEAMNFSLPLISWDIIGVREIIKNGQNGYLVEFGNYSKLQEKINKITQDEEIYIKIANRSFLDSKNYLIQHNVDRLMKIYYGK